MDKKKPVSGEQSRHFGVHCTWKSFNDIILQHATPQLAPVPSNHKQPFTFTFEVERSLHTPF